MFEIQDDIFEELRLGLVKIRDEPDDYDGLMRLVGDRRFVLIGEASHGTQEFYEERARITRRLVREKGVHAVAVEADWPDAYRVNRYVKGAGNDGDPNQALANFQRFPLWMWRNSVVRDFVDWLRNENERRSPGSPQLGFYGLDLYSLNGSIQAVLDYLDKVDPEAARRARYRYSCFDHYAEDTEAYGYAASFGFKQSCEDEVVAQLIELQRRATEYAGRDGRLAQDDLFQAEQNARLVKNAEQYYRTMFQGHISSWNLRGKHMADTLDSLAAHLDSQVGRSKIVIWAHNSHLGDPRATEQTQQGEWNLGQLVRERHPGDSISIGFTTYSGTVTAASEWGGPHERKRLRPGLPDSYEALFHQLKVPDFLLIPAADGSAAATWHTSRLERAIGVIYHPETERLSHYFHARLAEQFDAVIHLDKTSALEPLDRESEMVHTETPETYPSGI